jgi:hypothetical protein
MFTKAKARATGVEPEASGWRAGEQPSRFNREGYLLSRERGAKTEKSTPPIC